jgi:hypothetical protein
MGCCEATNPLLAGETSTGSRRAGDSRPLASGCNHERL